jgi:hypothetical protein
MWVLANQESWKIPKGWSEAINRKIKNDTKDKRKSTNNDLQNTRLWIKIIMIMFDVHFEGNEMYFANM